LFGLILASLIYPPKDLPAHEFQNPIYFEDSLNVHSFETYFPSLSSRFSEKTLKIYVHHEDDQEKSIPFKLSEFQTFHSFLSKCNVLQDFQTQISILKQQIIHRKSTFESQWCEVIFSPNKPSQMAPSTKGNRIYLPGLIKFCLTDGQENKIWLEKIAGLKRDYRVSIIIDSSYSCFNPLMLPHSIQTIISLIGILAQIEIPFFDLIIATSKSSIILSINQNSQGALDPNSSDIWISLLSSIPQDDVSVNLFDAVQIAMKYKSFSSSKRSYLFILTDGLVSPPEKNNLKNLFRMCRESSIEIFGIGLGFYPSGISSLFSKCIWSVNPNYLITALSVLFGNEIPNCLDFINLFANPENDFSKLSEFFDKYSSSWPELCVYKDLFKELRDKTLYSESIDDFQKEIEGIEGTTINPEMTLDNSMYKKNAFAGQKILFCGFWSKNIAGSQESDWVDPNYLFTRYDPNEPCVADVLDYYGISIVVVQNYKDAILKLQTGEFFSTWIICGGGTRKLPDGGNANLVGQFIECVDLFWKSGGAVIWWCDNDPLFYELNLFLEIAEFPEVGKSNLRIGPGSEGKTFLNPDDIRTSQKGTFNNQRNFDFRLYHRPSLAHNLVSIYEGYTISNAQDPTKISPFIPFSYDSKGGISSLFWLSDFEQTRGDMIIDCGFTKLFTELTFQSKDGTFRYIQNIAALTGQYEKNYRKYGQNGPKSFRPVSFSQIIDESVKWTKFTANTPGGPFDVLYMVDSTGSMGEYIQAAKEQCVAISNELKSKLPDFQFQFGGIFYRDPIHSPSDIHQTFLLTNNIERLQSQIGSVSANGGGGDGPEDWVGAYRIAINNINWRNGYRLIIHMADAPAHGARYGGAGHEEESPKLAPLIRQCSERKIKIIGMPIGGNYAQPSFDQCKAEYLRGEGTLYEIRPFSSGGSNLSDYFKDCIIAAVICAAPHD
jgi:hypothetical protein